LAIFLVAYGFRSACQIPAAVIVAAGKISTDAKFKIQESLVMLLLLVPCGMWYGATAVAILFALVYAWSFFRRQHFVSRSILAANP
jgi:hypothetical protein